MFWRKSMGHKCFNWFNHNPNTFCALPDFSIPMTLYHFVLAKPPIVGWRENPPLTSEETEIQRDNNQNKSRCWATSYVLSTLLDIRTILIYIILASLQQTRHHYDPYFIVEDKLREVVWFVCGHTARNGWNKDSNSSSLPSEIVFPATIPTASQVDTYGTGIHTNHLEFSPYSPLDLDFFLLIWQKLSFKFI